VSCVSITDIDKRLRSASSILDLFHLREARWGGIRLTLIERHLRVGGFEPEETVAGGVFG
jgi:hypothetical protein